MRWEDGQGPQGRNSRQLGLAQGLAAFPEAQEVAGLQRLMFLQMYCVTIAVIF